MKILIMAASLQANSVNKKLVRAVLPLLEKKGVTIDHGDFSEFMGPLYNADTEKASGIPKEVENYIERLHSADAHIISSPEYNYSVPGTLKNLIDWVSRKQPMPWIGQYILLLSASPSLIGGNRSLWHLRVPLEGCGSYVFPTMFSLPSAYSAFNDQGKFLDEKHERHLDKLLDSFIDFVAKKK